MLDQHAQLLSGRQLIKRVEQQGYWLAWIAYAPYLWRARLDGKEG